MTFAAVVFLFAFGGRAWAQPTRPHHPHGPHYGEKHSPSKPKTKAPANPHNSENWHPLSLDEQLNEIEKGRRWHNGDPPDPKADIGDSLGYFYRNAKTAVEPVALEAWRIILVGVLDTLMFLIIVAVISMVPGFAAKRREMTIEAVLIFIPGVVMYSAEWVGGIGMQGWVAVCLLVVPCILFVVSFFATEGAWKLLLLFGPVLFMVLLQGVGAINSVLNWVWHSPILALCILIVAIKMLRHRGAHPARPATATP